MAKIDRILKWLFPREDRFFDLFDRSTKALYRAAKELTLIDGVLGRGARSGGQDPRHRA